MCALAVALMAAGAIAELLGIGLVVIDIRAARQRALALAPRRFEQAMPVTAVVGRGQPSAVEGGALTPDQRIEKLERDVRNVDAWVQHRIAELRERVAGLALGAADEELATHQREEAIRAFLRDALTADAGRRATGVALISGGIILSLAGNLVALAGP